MNALGESPEMYLKTICELTTDQPIVPISDLAQRMGISPVSATEMVHRMEALELAGHLHYKGVFLTDHGRRRGLQVLRSHRLWERFLVDELGLPWAEVHEMACRLEHAGDPQLIEALAGKLGYPSTCPHGNIIPDPDDDPPEEALRPLAELDAGESGTLSCIRPENTTILRQLGEHGLRPGVQLEVQAIEPIDGLRTLQVLGRIVVIGVQLSHHVYLAARPDGGG